MNTEKRLMLAVAASVIIIVLYQAYMKQFVKPYKAGNINDTVATERVIEQALVPSVAQQATTAVSPTVSYDTVTISNDIMQIDTTDSGATINELLLRDYYNKEGQPYPLLVYQEGQPMLFETVFLSGNVPGKWQLDYSQGQVARYKIESDGLAISKTITLDKANHFITLDLTITNTSPKQQLIQYRVYNGYIETVRGHMDSRYLGADIFVDGKAVRRRASRETMQDGELIPGTPTWISTRGRYFSFLMKPGQDAESAFVQSRGKNDLCTGLVSYPITLMPHSVVKHTFWVYAGPNDLDAMMALDPTATEVINYGIFHIIGRLLFKGLGMFYHWTNNYGVAIILLALVISLIMLPLTRKSLHSMKEMQKIQPETELIRKQYSDNPQKMNKEIMGLYKKHKINPIGGCLPMLLQIPIFFSLYQVLLRSVELKGATFLWIKDLAEPDAAFALPSAMQNLPFLGGHINILPILMAIAMAFQQRLSQGGSQKMSEQQRLMAGIMPIMFGMIFYNMPSGLVLYWFTNTLFMLVIQEVVLKSRFFAKAV